jgi:cell shape-determining protein MreC
VPAAVPAPVAPSPDPAATTPPRIQARVLAVERGSDAKAALVAIDAGTKHGIKEGDRFAIQRQGATRVLARASQVKDDMTIALIIPGTWTNDQAEIAQDDVAVSVDDR